MQIVCAPETLRARVREKSKNTMDDIHLLHAQTQQYGDAVKDFLLAVTASSEADQRIVDQAVILRAHFEWFHIELDRLWQMQRSALDRANVRSKMKSAP